MRRFRCPRPINRLVMLKARSVYGPVAQCIGSKTWVHAAGKFLKSLLPWSGTSPFCCLDFSQATLEPRSGNPNGVVPVFARDSVATVTDFEGRVIPVLVGEARFQGARRVHNLVVDSVMPNAGGGWGANSATLVDGVATITAQAANFVRHQLTLTGSKRYKFRIRYKVDGRDRIVRFAFFQNNPTISKKNIDVNVVGGQTYDHFFIMDDPFDVGSGGHRIVIYIDMDFASAIIGDSITIYECCMELVNGDEQPPELVANPGIHGAGVDGVKYFPYRNGNTVDADGVVTENKGEAIPDIAYLNEPAATNLVPYSNDFTQYALANNAAGQLPVLTPDYEQGPVGPATRIIFQADLSVSASYSLLQLNLGSKSGAFAASVYLKTNDGSTKKVYFRCGVAFQYVDVGPYWKRYSVTETISAVLYWTIGARGLSDDYLDLSVCGAQNESGSVPSSYIPTEGAPVTRAADVLSYTVPQDPVQAIGIITDATALSSQSSYALFGDAYRQNGGTGNPSFTIQSSATAYWNNSGNFAAGQRSAHAHYAANKAPGVTVDWRMYRDGILLGGSDDMNGEGVGGFGLGGSLGSVVIGKYVTARRFHGLFHSVKLFADPLSDAELRDLTRRAWSCPEESP